MAFVSYTWWEYDSYKIHCFLTFDVVDTVQPLKILTKNGAMHNTTMMGHYEDAEKNRSEVSRYDPHLVSSLTVMRLPICFKIAPLIQFYIQRKVDIL